MPGNLQPLGQQFPIVNPDGTPTLYFIEWAQQKQIDISAGITAAQAQQLIDDWAAARNIIAGAGLTGGGALSANVTINADASAILDLLSDTQGTVLYRGASAWAALAPGTSGHFLKTNGAGANPEWAAGGGGGGGAWTLVHSGTIAAPVANVDVTGLGGYGDILVIMRLVTTSSSGNRAVHASIDGGSSFYTSSGDYVLVSSTAVESNTANFLGHSTASSSARTMIGLMSGNISGGPKVMQDIHQPDASRMFVASTDVIDALRFSNSAGNLTGGTIYVFGR